MNFLPTVGIGATNCVGSDRYPYTVIEVQSPKRIVVQADNYKRTDKNGLSESQTYEYSPNPDGSTRVLTMRKNGRWCEVGDSMDYGGWAIGYRSAYQDPSF